MKSTTPEQVIEAMRHWLEKAVIGLNLCPFAKGVHVKNQIRFVLSTATDVEALTYDLAVELTKLRDSSTEEIDTTLLIHPWVLTDFLEYNDFLDVAEEILVQLGLEGELQIASFHPQYQFSGTQPDDIENYTNRSPYPTLHLLRETSIDRAVASFPQASEIYEKNVATMRRLGHGGWSALAIDRPPASNCSSNEDAQQN